MSGLLASLCPMCGAPITVRGRVCGYCGVTLVHTQIAALGSGDTPTDKGDLRQLREFVRAHTHDGEAQYMLGLAYLQRGLVEPSIEHLRKAASLLPEVAVIHYNLSLALFADRTMLITSPEWAEMEKHIAIALRLDPTLVEATAFQHFFFGRKLDLQQKYQACIAEYGKAITACPDIALFYNNIGLAFYWIGNFEWSERAYRDAIERDSDDAQIYSNYCLLCFKSNQFDKGVEIGARAIELLAGANILPISAANAYNNYSLCLWKVGRIQDAITYIDRALALIDLPLYRQNKRRIQSKYFSWL